MHPSHASSGSPWGPPPCGSRVRGAGEEEEADDGFEEDVFALEGLAGDLDLNEEQEGAEEAARRLEMRRGGWEGQGHAAQQQQHQQAEAGPGPSSARSAVDEMASKLDSMMELTLGHLAQRIDQGGRGRATRAAYRRMEEQEGAAAGVSVCGGGGGTGRGCSLGGDAQGAASWLDHAGLRGRSARRQCWACSPALVLPRPRRMWPTPTPPVPNLNLTPTAGELPAVWDTLLGAFERTILNTHRSKFTQFLLFYACLRSPAHCPASLVGLLLDRLRDGRQPPTTRAACAAYLASFLARAAFLPDALVVRSLEDLSAFCADYVAACSSRGTSSGGAAAVDAGPGLLLTTAPEAMGGGASSQGGGLSQHHVLHAALQSVLYVLCYHMGPLMSPSPLPPQQQQQQQGAMRSSQAQAQPTQQQQDGSGGAASAGLADKLVAMVRGPVWQVLNHRLQPLAACLPTVAREFAQQAAALGIIDCRPLVPKVRPRPHLPQPACLPACVTTVPTPTMGACNGRRGCVHGCTRTGAVLSSARRLSSLVPHPSTMGG